MYEKLINRIKKINRRLIAFVGKKRQNVRFFFCIVIMVVAMKVYVDLVFFINFMYDLLLLISVSLERKIFPKFYRFLLGSLVGALSMFFLFFSFSSLVLFLFKFLISILMLLATFSYRNKNFLYQNIKSLYGSSIILGGLMYFLNVQSSYRQEGLIFFHDGTSINLIIIIIASPILFYLYKKEKRKYQVKQQLLHTVQVTYKQQVFTHQAYLDTGNTIKDPYKKRDVIVMKEQAFVPSIEESLLVPYKTVGHQGLLRCVIADELVIDEKKIEKSHYLIGFSEEMINIEGATCILPGSFMKEE